MPKTLFCPEDVARLVARQAAGDPSALTARVNPELPSVCVTSDNAMVLDTDGHFLSTTRADLAEAFRAYRAQLEKAPTRLAVFFHGGLVNVHDGLVTASQLLDPYAGAPSYPFFPVWDTGALDVLVHHWRTIFESPLFRTLHAFVSEAVMVPGGPVVRSFVELASSGVAGRPRSAPVRAALSDADAAALASAVDNDPVIRRFAATPDAVALREYDYIDPNAMSMLRARAGFIVVQIVRRIIERYADGRWHPGLATITEEILRVFFVGPFGEAMWDQMKASIEGGLARGDPNAGARALIDAIADVVRARKGNVDITLLAHSAGAIYVSRLLEELDAELADDGLPWNVDVVFFAAAIRVDRFSQTLQTVANRIAGFRSFELAEEFESSDSILKYVGVPLPPDIIALYPASLPYAVSGDLEDDKPPALGDEPLVGMQRYLHDATYDGEPAVEALRTFVTRQHAGIVLSSLHPDGPPGCRSAATTHGGFPREAETVDSTVAILKNGLTPP